mmetsp:Transcript_27715/g.77644  ORF Transcript_27715/g.77644 Transcript_27715/m.77644 type:complete len:203 (-) Transcript_27715:235-843(-)
MAQFVLILPRLGNALPQCLGGLLQEIRCRRQCGNLGCSLSHVEVHLGEKQRTDTLRFIKAAGRHKQQPVIDQQSGGALVRSIRIILMVLVRMAVCACASGSSQGSLSHEGATMMRNLVVDIVVITAASAKMPHPPLLQQKEADSLAQIVAHRAVLNEGLHGLLNTVVEERVMRAADLVGQQTFHHSRFQMLGNALDGQRCNG